MKGHSNPPHPLAVDILPTKVPAHSTDRRHRLTFLSALVLILFINLIVIGLAIATLQANRPGEEGKKGEAVVAPLCLPCQEVGVGREGEGEEVEGRGWRRFREGDRDLCCPLHYDGLASAVGQIYSMVLKEQQQNFENTSQPISDEYFRRWYGEPENTEQVVFYANHYKPSAHVTGIQPYDADVYYEGTSSSNNSLQTMCDWPLRFEPYRSTTQGHVRRLTWGLVVPVSGLYRVYSMINFYFPYPQNIRDIGKQGKHPREVVHQLTRYQRARERTTVLAQRNTTISTGYTDGLTSFLLTLQPLQVGDVISLSLSHTAARAVQDRWHAHGLFLVQ